MTTLIIPCAGRSSRFPDMKPKWMLTHPDGKLMIEKALSGLPLNAFNRIIITIVKEHSKTHEAKLILQQVFSKLGKKVEILELSAFTSSQSETVYQTLIKKKVRGAFVVKDSDNYVRMRQPARAEFVAGVDINTFGKEIARLKSKSFLIVNEQGIIVDIIEKRIVSERVCIGVYGFESPQKFMEAYEALNGKKGRPGETYMSHLISYLIGTGKAVYTYAQAQDYEDWGTLEDWKLTQQRHTTYFIDIDGILVKNRGKYGKQHWNNSLPVIEENLSVVKKLADNDAQIILTTARSEGDLASLKKLLKRRGIRIHAYITDCYHAPRVLINDFAATNPFPSAKAINIPRDGSLGNYLS